MKSRILITNAYSWYNKGDSGILLGMVKSLSTYFPKADFKVVSTTPEIDAAQLKKYRIETIGNVFNTISRFELTGAQVQKNDYDCSYVANRYGNLRKIRIFQGAKIALKLFSSAWLYTRFRINRHRLLSARENGFFDAYLNADIVISCGGGFLNDYSDVSLLNNLFQIYLSLMLKKPTIIYAQTIGPFRRKVWSVITVWILNKVDLILLREEKSEKLMREMGVAKPKIFVTADAAFALCPVSKSEAQQLILREKIDLKDRPLVGVTVRNWFFPGHSNPQKEYSNYLHVMSEAVDYLTEKLKATVVFMPEVIVHARDDDRIVASKIRRMVKNKEKVRIIASDLSPEEIMGIIGEMDLFIGTRMHSNIFALTMQVPTIAISYEHKTDGIMKMLDLSEFVVPIEGIECEELVSKIERVWKQKDRIKEKIAQKVKTAQSQAVLNAKLVKDFIDSSVHSNSPTILNSSSCE